MRTVTANAQTELDKNTGTELMVVLEIEWTDGGSVYYSDQDISGTETKIIEIGGFDTSMILEGSNDSQELKVILDDTDDAIKNIYSTNDVHKRPAKVYVLHKGLSLSDKILVFKGELVTPIELDAGQRTVSFNIMSKLESREVGFSMEEGDFPNIPEEALGKAWPLVFGQVCHLPAVKVRAPRRGYLLQGEGIHDFTLEPRICQAVKIQCPSQSSGNKSFATLLSNNTYTLSHRKTVTPDLECVNRRFGEICKLKDLLDQQVTYEHQELNIYNGNSFPQNTPTTIFVDNATFYGTFSGNTFDVIWRQHPEYADFDHVPCRDVPPIGYTRQQAAAALGGDVEVEWNDATEEWEPISEVEAAKKAAGGHWSVSSGGSIFGQKAMWVPEEEDDPTHFKADQNEAQAFASCEAALVSTPGLSGGPKEAWEYYDDMDSSDFFWAPAGSEVYMESESEILYIASLLPGTVDGVAAFREAPNGFRYLTEVDEDYYTVYETNYNGYTVVEVGLDKALSLYDDSWEDQIYVSFTSDVGPNPCDIIEWLVDKYTDMSVDAASFASVKSYLTNYPCNFYLTERKDVYELIQDIAYQSRCAVYTRNDVIYIRYLSVEPTSVRTLDKSDILSNSFVEYLSETEDVYTTHNITWKKGGAAVRGDKDPARKLTLKYNVDKYGTVRNSWDYYVYNIHELVLKSSTFWLIRKANSWKRVKFQLPAKHIDLDVGDCVTLDLDRFSSSSIKIVIESMNFNPDSHTVDVVCWTPIRSGEESAYYWAWPSQQSIHQIWPLAGDDHGGGGYNFDVTPPVGHLLTGGSTNEDQLVISSGDLHPSDLDDTSPSVVCELSDYINFDQLDPDIEAKQIAQSAARQQTESQMTPDGGGIDMGDETKKQDTEECGTGRGCNYKVVVTWHKSEAQGVATASGGAQRGGPCGGPCPCKGGCPSCHGPQWQVCHTYGAPFAAHAAANYFEAQYGHPDGWWQCEEVGVLFTAVGNGELDDDCSDIGDTSGSKDFVSEEEEAYTTALEETRAPTGLTGEEPIAE